MKTLKFFFLTPLLLSATSKMLLRHISRKKIFCPIKENCAAY